MSWLGKAGLNIGIIKERRGLKISKRKFIIKQIGNGYNIFLRSATEHPIDRNGFPTKAAAKKRLAEYIKKASKTI